MNQSSYVPYMTNTSMERILYINRAVKSVSPNKWLFSFWLKRILLMLRTIIPKHKFETNKVIHPTKMTRYESHNVSDLPLHPLFRKLQHMQTRLITFYHNHRPIFFFVFEINNRKIIQEIPTNRFHHSYSLRHSYHEQSKTTTWFTTHYTSKSADKRSSSTSKQVRVTLN